MPDGTSWLHTPRLALQRFTPDDLAFLTALFGEGGTRRAAIHHRVARLERKLGVTTAAASLF